MFKLQTFLSILVPPRDASADALQAWRMVIATCIVVLFVSMIALWSIAFGNVDDRYSLVTQYQLENFSDEVEGKLDDLTDMTMRQMRHQFDTDLRTLRVRQCYAIQERNVEATRAVERTIEQRKVEYAELFGERYDESTCAEVGVIEER